MNIFYSTVLTRSLTFLQLWTAVSSGVRGGGAAAPTVWKMQGKLCFQGKPKLLKNPEK